MKIAYFQLVILSLGILAGCSNEIDMSKGKFLSTCIEGGSTRSVCECAYDHLANHYGEEKLAKISKLQDIADAPHDWIEQATQAGIDCRSE